MALHIYSRKDYAIPEIGHNGKQRDRVDWKSRVEYWELLLLLLSEILFGAVCMPSQPRPFDVRPRNWLFHLTFYLFVILFQFPELRRNQQVTS